MRWLCLVPLQARRRVWVQAPADSCLPRWLEEGSAVDPVSQGRRISRAPRIFPGQDLAGLEVWLQTASLRAAGPNRAPQTLPAQALAGREAWLQTASLGAAGIDNRNSHRQFNPFLKEADRFYRQLLKVSSPGQERSSLDQDRRARDFLIFREKAPIN